MQKGKYTQYAVAGIPSTPGMRMNVRSNVRVPDSEAGGGMEYDRQPYYAETSQIVSPRRSITIPAHIGVIFLCAVFVIFGTMVLLRACERAELSKRISSMESSISQTIRDNTQLAVEVMEARDSARICYAAAQNLGMVAATGVDAVPVIAPDTRPFSNGSGPTESSPFSAGHGIITGSR